MGACVKSLLPLLKLVGMLGLLTVSASAEDVKVTFLFDQRLEYNGFPLIWINSSSETNSLPMTPTSDDIWVLTVAVTKGVPYEYNLGALPEGLLYECVCTLFNKTDPNLNLKTDLTVPEDYPLSIYPEIVTRYNCNVAACPFSADGKRVASIRQVV